MEAAPNVNVKESTDEYFATSPLEAVELIFRKALRQIIYSQNSEPLVEHLRDPITMQQMIMRVVAEELDKLKQNHMFKAEPYTVPLTQAPKTPRKKLVFSNPSLPRIYTGNEVLDVEGLQLELKLVDIDNRSGHPIMPITDDRPLVVELVVLNGDFGQTGTWTSQEFDKNIVEERSGKPPLLIGTVRFTLQDGKATIKDIKFTDNSSRTRSKTFKIGAKPSAPGINDDLSGVVLEAVTEAFPVNEYRMKSLAKHYPPDLHDEVWRLEKIGKNGPSHKKLNSAGICKVKEILDLSATDAGMKTLRGILEGLPEKSWKAMLNHAWTCKTEGHMSFWKKFLAQLNDEVLQEN